MTNQQITKQKQIEQIIFNTIIEAQNEARFTAINKAMEIMEATK